MIWNLFILHLAEPITKKLFVIFAANYFCCCHDKKWKQEQRQETENGDVATKKIVIIQNRRRRRRWGGAQSSIEAYLPMVEAVEYSRNIHTHTHKDWVGSRVRDATRKRRKQ